MVSIRENLLSSAKYDLKVPVESCAKGRNIRSGICIFQPLTGNILMSFRWMWQM